MDHHGTKTRWVRRTAASGRWRTGDKYRERNAPGQCFVRTPGGLIAGYTATRRRATRSPHPDSLPRRRDQVDAKRLSTVWRIPPPR